MDTNTQERVLTEQEALARLITLLDKAYEHYLAHPDNDGLKTGEGSVQVRYSTPRSRKERSSSGDRARIMGVSIYSRAFNLTPGQPGNQHGFDTVRAALAAVENAHTKEMATDWDVHYANLWADLEELR